VQEHVWGTREWPLPLTLLCPPLMTGREIIEPRIAIFTREIPPEPQVRHLLNLDPPDHGRYRNLTSKWFTPRTVKIWEPKVQQTTREVLDAAGEKGDIDFVADVSAPITIAVIALIKIMLAYSPRKNRAKVIAEYST